MTVVLHKLHHKVRFSIGQQIIAMSPFSMLSIIALSINKIVLGSDLDVDGLLGI